jgi:hypothetical protein
LITLKEGTKKKKKEKKRVDPDPIPKRSFIKEKNPTIK